MIFLSRKLQRLCGAIFSFTDLHLTLREDETRIMQCGIQDSPKGRNVSCGYKRDSGQNLRGGLADWNPEKEAILQFRPKGYLLSELPLARVSLWGYSSLHLIGWGPPTLWWEIYFTQSPLNSMLISSRNTYIYVSRIMFDHISGHWGPSKLMYKITHHT